MKSETAVLSTYCNVSEKICAATWKYLWNVCWKACSKRSYW